MRIATKTRHELCTVDVVGNPPLDFTRASEYDACSIISYFKNKFGWANFAIWTPSDLDEQLYEFIHDQFVVSENLSTEANREIEQHFKEKLLDQWAWKNFMEVGWDTTWDNLYDIAHNALMDMDENIIADIINRNGQNENNS